MCLENIQKKIQIISNQSKLFQLITWLYYSKLLDHFFITLVSCNHANLVKIEFDGYLRYFALKGKIWWRLRKEKNSRLLGGEDIMEVKQISIWLLAKFCSKNKNQYLCGSYH